MRICEDKRRIYEDKMKDIYKELLDTKDIKGYTQENLAWKKKSLHIINRYHKQISCDIHAFILSKRSFHIPQTYSVTYSN